MGTRARAVRSGATSSKAGVDLAPLRDAIDAVEKSVAATRWAKHADLADLGALRRLCDDLGAVGARKIEDAAELVDRLDPEARLAFAIALARAFGPGSPLRTAKLLANEPRVVLGDLEVTGELTVTSEVIVTGSVECAECFVDETGSLSVAGDLAARYVYAEGDLWIAAELKADVAWAEYEAGTLAVGQTLARRSSSKASTSSTTESSREEKDRARVHRSRRVRQVVPERGHRRW